MTEKPKIDCYPWAVPTEEQKRMFNALSYEEQLQMVRNALIAGEESGFTEQTAEEIRAELKDELHS